MYIIEFVFILCLYVENVFNFCRIKSLYECIKLDFKILINKCVYFIYIESIDLNK